MHRMYPTKLYTVCNIALTLSEIYLLHVPISTQLSVSDNSLVRMEEVCALHNLVSLNLQNNSLSEISGELDFRSIVALLIT